jgi:hypothetical protein
LNDAEAKNLLNESFKDTPVGNRVRMTGWVEQETVWERTEKGWKKVEVRTSTDDGGGIS